MRNALADNNFTTAAGQVKGDFVQTTINAETSLDNAAAFGKLVVVTRGDALIRLDDIATIELGPESANSSSVFDGLKAVFIGIFATPTSNPLTVIGEVRKAFPDIQRQLPAGIEAAIAYDATKFINASIEEVVKTLLEAALIVIVVIFLFLGNLRSTLIPIVTIPLSLVGVMFVLLALGYSINLLTLLALVLAIGLVVDDAIVVVENIHRHIEEGMQPFDAALKGAREIAVPGHLHDHHAGGGLCADRLRLRADGALFREFAFTLAGAVVVSGVIALTLSPMMASKLLRREQSSGRFVRFLDRIFDSLRQRYAAPAHPHARVPAGDDPDPGRRHRGGRHHVHDDAEGAGARGGPGHPLQHRQDAADRQSRLSGAGDVRAQQGVRDRAGEGARVHHQRLRQQRAPGHRRHPVQAVGGAPAHAKADPAEPAAQGGRHRRRPGDLLRAAVAAGLDRRAAGAVRHHHHGRLSAAGAGAGRGAGRSRTRAGSSSSPTRDLKFETPQVELKIDHDKANRLGITMQDIGTSLATLLGGNYVNRFNLYGRSYQVIPQVPRDFRLTPEWLKRYQVRTAAGALVPLSSIASVGQSVQPNALTSFQQLNSATLSGVPFPGRTVGEAIDFLKATAVQKLPEGFSYDFQGESRQYVQEGSTLVITFVFALIIIYLVLAAQYESFRDPLIILIALPTAMFGALIPLNLGLATVNIYTQVGLVTLIGLISKHGILMVDYANHLQENEGLDRRAAIEKAAAIRLRPILMTTAAMVVGMVPLLTASGAGAASRFSIGIVIAAGMTIGTIFTLFVTPAVYTYVAREHRAERAARPQPSGTPLGERPIGRSRLARELPVYSHLRRKGLCCAPSEVG